jgi:hypothetical protein
MPHLLPRAALALLAAGLAPTATLADPLHPIAGDAYWHHESNFVFPATLAEFTRVGAPQELDGSTTVVAHYARGVGAARVVVVIEVVPVADVPTAPPVTTPSPVVRVIDHAGWRVTVSAPLADDAARERIEALIHALPVARLGTVDAHCPNPGCGSTAPAG